MSESYDMPDIEKTALIKNWLGRKGLPILETLTQAEKEKCETSKELFKTLKDKFKPLCNDTIKSLQFLKLNRQSNGSLEEWMGKLRIANTECNYKEIDRQFTHQLNDSDMSIKIIINNKCDKRHNQPS